MNIIKYLITAIIAGALLLSGVLLSNATHQNQPKAGGFSSGTNYLTSATTTLQGVQQVVSKSITVGPQNSVQVLATSTARTWAYFTASSTQAINCNLSDVPATVTGGGLIISENTPFTISSSNLYIGAIQCEAAASTTLYEEYAQ